ncbi:FecR domain-containing protein [Chitinophaga sp. MM2321]|uniref:FecR family protein n=1 Tax=Chitinophaga sp. MM2321 TaxID=3137178 RepID=UPI0032D58598
MPPERIKYLITQYFNNTCTTGERKELAGWISETPDDEVLKEAFGEAWEKHVPAILMPAEVSDRIMASVFAAADEQEESADHPWEKRVRYLPYKWWLAAASIVLLGVSSWFLFITKSQHQVAESSIRERYKNEVPPGGDRATLTLADGTTIALDSAANGLLTQQGNTKVMKLANGQLAYDAEGPASEKVLHNTIHTPRGGTYRLILPDGTAVWLNAASSITYPASFTGKERSVTITGEAYFEVTGNENMPFRVNAGGVDIAVLGTSFNVNAYTGEAAIRTTLLEGAVKVSDGKTSSMLRPGQQAQLTATGTLAVIDNVDTDEIVAWKNGYFQFTDADMQEVMGKLEKWYDVQVIYEGDIPKRSFGGGIQRSLPLSKVLRILEENDVRFRIEGRNITVLK